jgi:hypothetical protein
MATMAWKFIGNLVIVVHPSQPPTDAEWDALTKEMIERNRVSGGRLRDITFTDGGGPNATQRHRFNAAAGTTVPVAIVTSSVAVRAIVFAFTAFNKHMKAFAPADLGKACEHLGVSPDGILDEVVRLRAQLREPARG